MLHVVTFLSSFEGAVVSFTLLPFQNEDIENLERSKDKAAGPYIGHTIAVGFRFCL